MTTKTSRIIEAHEIMQLLPHRYPFLLVDRVINFEEGKWLTAIKNISVNEPCFTGHFPENPILPGVLILEALAQAMGILAFKTHELAGGEIFILPVLMKPASNAQSCLVIKWCYTLK